MTGMNLSWMKSIEEYFKDSRFKKFAFNKTLRVDGQFVFDRHYVYGIAWVVRALKKISPKQVVDIGSDLSYISMISTYFPVVHMDIHPPDIKLDNLEVIYGDITNLEIRDVECLTCLHVIEHIGLGRYESKVDKSTGNVDWKLDAKGDLRAIESLKKAVKLGGYLLISVPVAKESKIVFNLHRIYEVDWIIEMFEDEFELIDFTLIPEKFKDGGLIRFPSTELLEKQNYGCGCFVFKKK